MINKIRDDVTERMNDLHSLHCENKNSCDLAQSILNDLRETVRTNSEFAWLKDSLDRMQDRINKKREAL